MFLISAYWSVVKEVLGPMDVKHFDKIEGINTDAGRGENYLFEFYVE